MHCAICHAPADTFATATILSKYQVAYFRCTCCGFVRVEEPYWLDEAYSSAITGSDVGLVQRNWQMATVAKVVISLFSNPAGRFVDYAGGYGLFVRLMRDAGFDFSWYDKYCANLFARDFAAGEPTGQKYDLLTAFEVFEHLTDPVVELDRMLAFSRNILFTTQILPEPAPRPGEWWYYGLEHGQHIGFYTRRSLELLAQRLGLNFSTNGASMHIFSERRLPQPLFFGTARYKTARFLAPLFRRESLVAADYRKTTDSSPYGRES